MRVHQEYITICKEMTALPNGKPATKVISFESLARLASIYGYLIPGTAVLEIGRHCAGLRWHCGPRPCRPCHFRGVDSGFAQAGLLLALPARGAEAGQCNCRAFGVTAPAIPGRVGLNGRVR
jgi:hypothetical protein